MRQLFMDPKANTSNPFMESAPLRRQIVTILHAFCSQFVSMTKYEHVVGCSVNWNRK